MDKIRPFFKGNRKYSTIVFGILPLALLTTVIIQYILYFLCGVSSVQQNRELLLSLTALLPGYLIYAPLAVMLSSIELVIGSLFRSVVFTDTSTVRKIIMTAAPILFYGFLLFLFFRYCYFYKNKKIKAYKRSRKALKVIWIIFAVSLFTTAAKYIDIL